MNLYSEVQLYNYSYSRTAQLSYDDKFLLLSKACTSFQNGGSIAKGDTYQHWYCSNKFINCERRAFIRTLYGRIVCTKLVLILIQQ